MIFLAPTTELRIPITLNRVLRSGGEEGVEEVGGITIRLQFLPLIFLLIVKCPKLEPTCIKEVMRISIEEKQTGGAGDELDKETINGMLIKDNQHNLIHLLVEMGRIHP